jgi:hypothetical protein
MPNADSVALAISFLMKLLRRMVGYPLKIDNESVFLFSTERANADTAAVRPPQIRACPWT